MRISILGKAWKMLFVSYVGGKRTKRGLGKGGDLGSCSGPDDKPGNTIKIRDDLRGELLLDTIIHEMLHATNWSLDETHVDRTASDIARTLKRPEIWARIATPE